MAKKHETTQEIQEAEVIESVTEQKDTTKQPEPSTTDYDVAFALSDRFVSDLITCLGEMAYVQSNPFIQFAQQNKSKISIAHLNEFIHKIEMLPWKYVHLLLHNVQTEAGREAYFTRLKEDKE